MLKETEISEGELCWFAFKYPSAFRLITRMIKENQLVVVREDTHVSGC